MTQMLFNKTDYTLQTLLGDIEIGRIGLPDIQRPFVWADAKIRDLFDFMLRGCPAGYLPFRKPGGERGETRTIGRAACTAAEAAL